MKNIRIVSHKERIDEVIARFKHLPDDEQVRSHWAKYVCVLTSGFLEKSLQTLCNDYTLKRASPQVAHFVAKHLDRFQNPKMEKILSLLQEFAPEFRQKIELETKGKLSDAVNSVVANRHSIAHGAQVGLSAVAITEWYKSVVVVVEKIESLLT